MRQTQLDQSTTRKPKAQTKNQTLLFQKRLPTADILHANHQQHPCQPTSNQPPCQPPTSNQPQCLLAQLATCFERELLTRKRSFWGGAMPDGLLPNDRGVFASIFGSENRWFAKGIWVKKVTGQLALFRLFVLFEMRKSMVSYMYKGPGKSHFF